VTQTITFSANDVTPPPASAAVPSVIEPPATDTRAIVSPNASVPVGDSDAPPSGTTMTFGADEAVPVSPTDARAMNFAIVNGKRVPVDEDPNTVGTFLKHYGDQINPVPLGQLLPFPKEVGGAGWDAPLQAIKSLNAAHEAVRAKAIASYNKGDYGTAARHAFDWLLLGVGPALDTAADEYQSGHSAAGTGDALGLATTLLGPQALHAARESAAATKLATAAENGAASRAVETMAPQVGPNKVRLGTLAADVGPDVLRKTSAVTRAGLLEQAGEHLDASYTALDAAYDKVPNTRMYATGPIKLALTKAIRSLSVSGIGGLVEPATRASRIAALRQALAEVKGLGSVANIDNLRKLRIAWDEGAKAVFTPNVAQDYLKVRGAGSGWADARSALNDYLVTQHPELIKLNADASLWKKAVDVMQAAEEADRVRPTVGRSTMAHGLGAAAGASLGGGWGAVVGTMIGPSIEHALANLRPSMKILVGRQMANLAEALRANQGAKAQSLIGTLKALLEQGALKVGQTAGNNSPRRLVPVTVGATPTADEAPVPAVTAATATSDRKSR
jgi:hypothetical protein